ncbi:Spermidine synthase [Acropora cervicornis]|uniref:Spermidine synthase n=1 Tax=Acropora cervicornis TaxID=6130 RepID=A0AAD9Q9T4_ACRCE|nr:Spermidine synthase [Acropora cervicornis]
MLLRVVTSRMNRIQNGWFSEINKQWPGQALSLEVEEVLFEGKSKYQDIIVFKSFENYNERRGTPRLKFVPNLFIVNAMSSVAKLWINQLPSFATSHGKVLVLDGVIQCTESDEFSYQEMITFLPLNSHPCPKKVLIIGGGDGGVIREVVKHPAVESIVLCEIDEKYLPKMACGFSSSKLTQFIGDGFEYMKEHENEFDVIITDSSDPVGPAESLFQQGYYELMRKALKPDGILCCQGECLWLDLLLIKSMDTRFEDPVTVFTESEIEQMGLQYYNAEVHKSAFVLPQFAKKKLFP